MRHVEITQSPTDPGFVQNPYRAYRAFRRHRAFWWTDYDMLVFPGFDDVSAMFRDRRFGREVLHVATRAELGWDPIPDHLAPFHAFEDQSLLQREPPAHTRLRGLVNRAFVSRRIEALRPRITELAYALARDLKEGDDLIAAYCTPIPLTIIAELLGVPSDMAPRLLDWSHRMVAMYQARRSREIEDAAVAATGEFSAYVRGLIGQRRQAPGGDLLSALVAAEEAGDRLSEDEVVATAILLLNAGHEATVHALGNAIATLLEHGGQVGGQVGGHPRLHVDPATAPQLVEEALRFDPPLHMFTRFALEDMDWDGIPLRKGQEVGLLIGSANRDGRINPDPDRFDPGRARPAHVSLGGGIHFCVGAPLARLEMQVALAALFDVLGPGFAATAGPYRDIYHFHGLTELRLGRVDDGRVDGDRLDGSRVRGGRVDGGRVDGGLRGSA